MVDYVSFGMIVALGISDIFSMCFMSMAFSLKLMTILVNISLKKTNHLGNFNYTHVNLYYKYLPHIQPTGPPPPTHSPPLEECLLNSKVWGTKAKRQGGVMAHSIIVIYTRL